jgi:hypothetical protein
MRLYRVGSSYTVIMQIFCSAIIVVALIQHPILTNDGPVHAAFAHLLYTNISDPLQATAYVVNHRLSPNWATYIVMKMLIPLVGDHGAEALVQAACVVLPAWAGYACIRAMGQATVASLLIYPVMLNELFLLGLYNSALACAAYFAAIGLFFRLDIKGRWRDAAALSAALIVAYFCHASGFVAAWATVAGLIAYRQLRQARRGHRLADSWLAKAAIALLLPLPLIVWFALASGQAPVAYDIPVQYRVSHFAQGWLFRTVTGSGAPALIMVAMIIGVGGLTVLREVSDWRPRNWRPKEQGARPSTGRGFRYGATCVAVAFALALIFPEIAGGGWSHFRRFEVYAYLALVLAMAEFPYRAWQKAAVGLMASLIFAGLFAAMMHAQLAVDRDLAQFAEVDRQVGSHCTVMPVVVQDAPAKRHGKAVIYGYNPYQQATNRMELHDDRVVLYNYLSRLNVYPIKFRSNIEPQVNLFEWEPWQLVVDYSHFDIAAYQRRSHLNVDYILVWGSIYAADPDLQETLRREQSSALAVAHSSSGLLTLIRRPTRGQDACTG